VRTTVTDTPLHRFHRLLVSALRDRGPTALERPFTIAEIYQDLVPYRRFRDQLGVEMNGDYEHLLMRLLSGEGEFVRLDSEQALRAIRKELEQSNPNTGVHRDFAAADVHLETEQVPDDVLVDRPDAGVGTPPSQEPVQELLDDAPPPGGPAAVAGSDCPWCRGSLPDRPGLRFCPHCGADVRVVPCPACQEPLEPGWRFCVRCGQETGTG
jgi:hypothetical protein